MGGGRGHDSSRPAGVHRQAVRNRPLVRLVAAQMLGGAAEWAAVIALLVHGFERGGARATGLTSLASFLAPLIAAPVIAVACASHRLQSVRRAGLGGCVAGSAGAGIAVLASWPLPVVVAFGVLAPGGLTVLAATGSSSLPAVVRTPRELVAANLWLGHGAAVCVLVGPLFASAMLAIGSPAVALLGCAGLGLVAFAVTSMDPGPPAAHSSVHPVRSTLQAARSVVRRPGGPGLVAVSFGRHAVVGAFDVLIVVICFEALDLDATGSALMNAAFGGGAVMSVLASTWALRGARLAAPIVAALLVGAALCVVLALTLSTVPAFAIVASLGLVAALVNTLSRMLLQRSADPATLGQVFGLLALTDGLALIAGSGLAQAVLAVGDVEGALVAVGLLVAVIGLVSIRSIWRADAAADVPVVEMSLLRPTSIFGPLPPFELESLARAASYVEFERDAHVIRQGEPGDAFYVVAAGEFDVVMSGQRVRIARRGDTFGEVALLADVTRTATVTALVDGVLLSVDRGSFLDAVAGSAGAKQAAWGAVRAMDLDTPVTHPDEA